MAARTPPFALRTTAGLGLGLIAATLLLSGCGNTGVGVAASNRGAAVGVSVGTPNIDSSQRDKWPALPPPQLMTSGRSVTSRMTKRGFARDKPSSWIPPESVNSNAAASINSTIGG